MTHTQAPREHIEPGTVEPGEDVTEAFEVRRPTGVVIAVRLTHEEADRLEHIAEREGKTLVETARAAVLAAIAWGSSSHTAPADSVAPQDHGRAPE